jgi:predicted protein tyrosine phosphatase
MPVIAVCSLALVPSEVARLKPWGLMTLLSPGSLIDTPEGILIDRHLRIGVNDIIEPGEGLITPQLEHVQSVLEHARTWDQSAPLLIHCWAGVSRSTASAFMASCLINPDVSEDRIAREIRTRSPTATPNRLLVSIADDIMNRGGRMVDAVDAIGAGEACWEGVPFEMPALWSDPR